MSTVHYPLSTSWPDPHPRRALVPLAHDAEPGERVDHGLLEQAHVVVQAEAVGVEVEDRVDDQLAGAVVGDVAAAVGFGEVDAGGLELRGGGEEVLGRAGAAGDGDDG